MKKIIFTATLLACSAMPLLSQSIQVGSAADQYLRFLQLTNQSGDSAGLVSRPLTSVYSHGQGDSTLTSLMRTPLHVAKGKKIYGGVLPLSLEQQYVSHHPFSPNDGSFIAAKGYQARLSGGLYGKLGPLEAQLKPELVYAANVPYKQTRDFGSIPSGTYRKVLPGQSAVRLAAGPIAVSVSTENLWWGPGVFHSLLMSNQAPGFLHVKLHTAKPLKTPIGKFEWTLLGGLLQANSELPYENTPLRYRVLPAFGKRYLNAYVFSYQPFFAPGLSIGVTRALQQYKVDIDNSGQSAFRKYLPVILKPVQKQNALEDDQLRTDQLASAFFRWLLRKSKAEVYAEFGFNDYKANLRDYAMNLPHSAAYLVGIRKAFSLPNKAFIDAGIEITQMSQTPDRLVRDAGNWYEHGAIPEGYTNENQGMGAVFATNAQTFQLAHQKGVQRTSVLLQRFQRNPHFSRVKWNDYLLGFAHIKPWKGFLVEGQINFIKSSNYGWQKGLNPFQILAKAGLHYYFHD